MIKTYYYHAGENRILHDVDITRSDLLADPAWAVDYALVPETEHATLRDEGGDYNYVNCFYTLAWRGE